MQEDAEFRQVVELLAAVTHRAALASGADAEANQAIPDLLLRMVESDEDLMSVLASELERAFPI